MAMSAATAASTIPIGPVSAVMTAPSAPVAVFTPPIRETSGETTRMIVPTVDITLPTTTSTGPIAAATSATPGGAGDPPAPEQAGAVVGYVALRRIRYGTKDAEGQRISRTYEPGERLDLDDDTAAVLLQRGDVKRA